MEFKSTRSTEKNGVSAAYAIKTGLAQDGGLYMPTEIPKLPADAVSALRKMSYPERAAYILSLFLTDYTKEELLTDACLAYSEDKFRGGAAPVHRLENGIYVLELWHGPTAAFKDIPVAPAAAASSRSLAPPVAARAACGARPRWASTYPPASTMAR